MMELSTERQWKMGMLLVQQNRSSDSEDRNKR